MTAVPYIEGRAYEIPLGPAGEQALGKPDPRVEWAEVIDWDAFEGTLFE